MFLSQHCTVASQAFVRRDSTRMSKNYSLDQYKRDSSGETTVCYMCCKGDVCNTGTLCGALRKYILCWFVIYFFFLLLFLHIFYKYNCSSKSNILHFYLAFAFPFYCTLSQRWNKLFKMSTFCRSPYKACKIKEISILFFLENLSLNRVCVNVLKVVW